MSSLFFISGRDERYFDKFVVSPDNQYLVFLGRDGYILLVSNKVGKRKTLLHVSISLVCVIICCSCSQTKQWIGELKMSGNVRSVSFTSDSRFMISSGSKPAIIKLDSPPSLQIIIL